MLYVVGIECDLFSECILVSAIDLSHPRDPWPYREYLLVRLIVEIDLTGLMRARSDERHISAEHIVQLGELIDRESLDDTTEPHTTGVILDFIEGSFSGIFCLLEFLLIC